MEQAGLLQPLEGIALVVLEVSVVEEPVVVLTLSHRVPKEEERQDSPLGAQKGARLQVWVEAEAAGVVMVPVVTVEMVRLTEPPQPQIQVVVAAAPEVLRLQRMAATAVRVTV